MYAQGSILFFPVGHFGELVGAEIDHADGGYQEHEFVGALEHKRRPFGIEFKKAGAGQQKYT